MAVETTAFRHHGDLCGDDLVRAHKFRAGDTLQSVYDCADRALYEAKAQGRNGCPAT